MGITGWGDRRARRRARAIAIVAGVVAGATVLAGCLPSADPWKDPTAPGPGNGHHVGVIGDSLVVLTQVGLPIDPDARKLTDAITGLGFYESTSEHFGATTDDLFGADDSRFVGFPSPGADIQIIALGTNDAHDNYVPVDRYEANLRRWIDTRIAGTCFGLVNVFTGTTRWGLNVTGPAYNDAIARIVADHPNVHLIDWNSYALAHPELYPNPPGPHPNAAGEDAYRLFITLGAEGCGRNLDGGTAPGS